MEPGKDIDALIDLLYQSCSSRPLDKLHAQYGTAPYAERDTIQAHIELAERARQGYVEGLLGRHQKNLDRLARESKEKREMLEALLPRDLVSYCIMPHLVDIVRYSDHEVKQNDDSVRYDWDRTVIAIERDLLALRERAEEKQNRKVQAWKRHIEEVWANARR